MSDKQDFAVPRLVGAAVSRRGFLRVGGAIVTATAGAGLLAACAGGTDPGGQPASGSPVRGGTMRFGCKGGASTDTLDAHNYLTGVDGPRLSALYDPLVRMDESGQPKMALAESMEPNADGTEWTVRLREGVQFHDGKILDADDVLFSFRRILENNFPGVTLLGPLNPAASTAVDPRTVVLKFDKPYAILPQALSCHWFLYIVPVGYDPAKPIGTGPFTLVSFTPGSQSEMKRFANYWDSPKPYLDELVILDISDETSQLNALLSGQVNAINLLSASSLAALQGTSTAKLIASEKTGGYIPFTVRVDQAPYRDVRVRTALKLVVDRPAMLTGVFAGRGEVGNDIFGRYDPAYDPSLMPQRQQDLEQARSLLKAAGHEDLAIELIPFPEGAGALQAAELFATQASGAGIRVQVTPQPATQYYANSYATTPFSQDYWGYYPYLLAASQSTLAGAPFNTTHFDMPEYAQLFNQATSTLDDALRTEIQRDMMKIDYDQGGLVIPSFFPVVDAVASNVQGVEPTVTAFPLRTYQFQDFWIQG
ncbi:ABC transporter substrate-binding protein [Mycolicibacterium tokaiense]|nr:ABC transporter substrate-binding protein [Mycolicibacterium tokaiense]